MASGYIQMGGWVDWWVNGGKSALICLVDELIGKLMAGWMDGWVKGLMGGFMDKKVVFKRSIQELDARSGRYAERITHHKARVCPPPPFVIEYAVSSLGTMKPCTFGTFFRLKY